ncbi:MULTISPECIES: hypothetical protein [Shewanella]|jgi:hypothetical protein|uniref:hypothetical protein n=1 Tax=Shewanella TaxID=22 RepID=UPI000C7DCFCE|nr:MULTISPECIES: hypothetical protein [Shewanella]MCL1056701.1 hypothetical protein [Shewanella gelidimarina]PKG56903.1 hypothetical protein CXF82_12490 [Shewanella sp. GutDb-MelDb]PKG74402.1 hypothetical protein CXF86_12895 [Shewanella sp. GutCb]
MRSCLIFTLFTALCLFIGYHAYFFIMPSVEINNQSGQLLTRVEVSLPNNNLVFDNIDPSKSMRIHHSTEQVDGEYIYRIRLSSGEQINGRCGYVTHNQYMKVLALTVNNEHHVNCVE